MSHDPTRNWQNEDPRNVVYKRAEIILLKRVQNGWQPFAASVETKHGWSISIHHHNPEAAALSGVARTLTEVDEWDPDWLWTYAPEVNT